MRSSFYALAAVESECDTQERGEGGNGRMGLVVVILLTISVTVAMLAACAYVVVTGGHCAPMGAEQWKMENNEVRKTELYRNLMHCRRMFIMCEKVRLRRCFCNPFVITLKIRPRAVARLLSRLSVKCSQHSKVRETLMNV